MTSSLERELDDKTTVYCHYNFNTYSECALKLPIHDWKKEIIQTLENDRICVVVGATGSGKSTQVPQFVLDDCYRQLENARIVVTQPRRLAAMTLAQRVCDERGWRLGNLVGYQVGLDKKTNKDTLLTFMTTEVLVQKIIQNKDLSSFTHLIIDEVHERDSHTDFLLLLVKKLLSETRVPIKLVLMSATIESERFAEYFGSCINGLLVSTPIIEVAQKTVYPIEIFYLQEVLSMLGLPDMELEEDRFHYKLLGVCRELIMSFDNEHCGTKSGNSSKRGAVLVFLPGVAEIEALIDVLTEVKHELRLVLLPLHSMLPATEQRQVFEPVRPSERKVIISTNIAESSITVSDCTYVIDFCMTKNLACDPETHYTKLMLQFASVANCDQRAGRTGRVGPGKVFRLVPKTKFQTFRQYASPEMKRIPLSSTVLKAKRLDMGSPLELLSLAMDRPEEKDIISTILILKQIGAMTLSSDSTCDGELTYLGKIASLLPLDPKLSKLIVMGCLFGCARDAIVIAAGLSLNNLFSRPFQKELVAHMNRVSMANGSSSDCVAIINAYELWCSNRRKGVRSRSDGAARNWATKNYVQAQVLNDMDLLIAEIMRRLESRGFKFDYKNIKNEKYLTKLKICIASAFYPNYFLDTAVKSQTETYQKDILDFDPFTTVWLDNVPAPNMILYKKDIQNIVGRYIYDFNVFIYGRQAFIVLNDDKAPGKVDDNHELATRIVKLSMMVKLRLIPRIRKQFFVVVKRPDIDCGSSGQMDLSTWIERNRLPGPTVKTWEVRPCYVVDACNFYVVESHAYSEFLELCKTAIEIKHKLQPLTENYLHEGNVCLVPFKDTYYRAVIKSCTDRNAVLVTHFDVGTSDKVNFKAMKVVPYEMISTPRLAIQCTLSGIIRKPELRSWPKAANDLTASVLKIGEVITLEIFSVAGDVVHAVVRCEKPDGTFGTLQQQLVNKGFALRSEEVHLSKESNLKREEFLRSTSYFLSDQRYRDNNKFRVGEQRKNLGGPYSPLESTFMPCVNSHLQLHVELDSVNSPCIDVLPDCEIPQFLVASLLQKGKNLIGRCTTLMPRKLGLAEITTLLFCPTAELIPCSPKEGSDYYKGFIAGLGYDSLKKGPLFPQGDITLFSTFKITPQILKLINEIRYQMSFTLSRLFEDSNFNLMKCRTDLEMKLHQLLDMEKEVLDNSMETIMGNVDYWHSIPLEDRLLTTGEELDVMVYPLLPGSSKIEAKNSTNE